MSYGIIDTHKPIKTVEVSLTLPPAHPEQYKFITYLDKHPDKRFVVAACGTKWGKAELISNLIPTTFGFKKMQDIVVDDYVFDHNGKPTKVIYTTEIMYNHKCYRVTFSDSTYVDVDKDHLWEVQSHYCRKNIARVNSKNDRAKSTNFKPEILTTEEIKQNLYVEIGGIKRPNYTVDCCGPVEFPEQKLPIHPYLYGCYLGDGTEVTGEIACDPDEQSVIENIRSLGYKVQQSNSNVYLFKIDNFRKLLLDNNMLTKRVIPECYKIASVEQRLELLKGLLDTDGTIDKYSSYITFDNTNKVIADLVAYLARSLGIKVKRSSRIGKFNGVEKKLCYRVYFKTNLKVFGIKRKLDKLNNTLTTKKSHQVTITDIEEIESSPVKCIKVENSNGLYITSENFRVTHNTFGCSCAMVKRAWDNYQSLNWWVAPTYKQAGNAFDNIEKLLPSGTYRTNVTDFYIELLRPDGKPHSRIEFKSAEKPGNLRGYGVNFMIVDEAAYIDFASYESLKTTMMQTYGNAMIISTPKGRGWFYDVYRMGMEFEEDGTTLNPNYDPLYFSMRCPTFSNPTIKKQAIDDYRKTMPEDSFRQEILAEFLLDSAGVFRGVRSCVRGELQYPTPFKRYIMGLDLARLNDYTVITILDENNHLVFFERLNKVDWSVQQVYVKEIAKKYNDALVVIDSTGVGDPILEALKKSGVNCYPYKISSNQAKVQLIDKLRLAIEKQQISFPNIPVLLRELEAFEHSISDAGVVRYSSPSGLHDDCVISLALANWVSNRQPFVYKQHNLRGF